MKGDNDQSPDKPDNKATSSGGKNRLPLYICAGVVAVALAIGGYFAFADNAANPGVENNVPQGPNDPYNNGGGIATGNGTTDPAATVSPTPNDTPETTLTPTPPDPAPSDEPTLNPASGGDIVVVITPTGEVTTVPTATATIVPPPSKAPATPNNPPTPPPPTGTPMPIPTPKPNPMSQPTKAPETQAPKEVELTPEKIASTIAYMESELANRGWTDIVCVHNGGSSTQFSAMGKMSGETVTAFYDIKWDYWTF